jgi:hypothetical protein
MTNQASRKTQAAAGNASTTKPGAARRAAAGDLIDAAVKDLRREALATETGRRVAPTATSGRSRAAEARGGGAKASEARSARRTTSVAAPLADDLATLAAQEQEIEDMFAQIDRNLEIANQHLSRA